MNLILEPTPSKYLVLESQVGCSATLFISPTHGKQDCCAWLRQSMPTGRAPSADVRRTLILAILHLFDDIDP